MKTKSAAKSRISGGNFLPEINLLTTLVMDSSNVHVKLEDLMKSESIFSLQLLFSLQPNYRVRNLGMLNVF